MLHESCVCEESDTEKGDVCYVNRVCVFETAREMRRIILRKRSMESRTREMKR